MLLNNIIGLIDRLACLGLPTNENGEIGWFKVVAGWKLVEEVGILETIRLMKKAEEVFRQKSLTYNIKNVRFMIDIDEIQKSIIIRRNEVICYLLLLDEYKPTSGVTLEEHFHKSNRLIAEMRAEIVRKTGAPCFIVTVIPVCKKDEVTGREEVDCKMITPFIFGQGPV